MKDQLQAKHIPLTIINAPERAGKVKKILEFAKEHDCSHIYGNLEYEVDELRRDIALVSRSKDEQDLSVELLHDQTIVTPGEIKTGAGTVSPPSSISGPFEAGLTNAL